MTSQGNGFLLICVLISAIGHSDLHAKAPFVAGFDRFAESKEISASQAGRLLLTELSCIACHQSPEAYLQPKGGPDLSRVGRRVQQPWLTRFLHAPGDIKPGTTMPDVLAGLSDSEKASAIPALTAFLMTLTGDYPEIKAGGASPVPFQFWMKGDVNQGEALYHKVGCVACHDPDQDYETVEHKPTPLDQMIEQLDPEELKELGLSKLLRPVRSVPHGQLSEKFHEKSLTFFLMDPEKDRPAGRMPNFQLSPMDAAHVAAYLLSRHSKDSPESSDQVRKELVARGREFFVSLRCANCHPLEGLKATEFASPFEKLPADLNRGCVGKAREGVPHYPLSEFQRSSLSAAMETTSEFSLKDQFELSLLQLNCYGCHERDEKGGVGRNRKAYLETVRNIDLGDEGRIPPPLTGVGSKLTQAWLKKVLAGNGKVRPHFTARMPQFPSKKTADLPAQFVQVDGYQEQSEQHVFGDSSTLAKEGRLLMDTGCVQCHPIRGEALPGVVGVDLGDVTTRIHPAWFQKFLFNPGEVKPRTRMPTFFPNGKSSNSTILDGDVDRQIAALWAYLKKADQLELPEKILTARSQNFELVPTDKPIVLRTFMEEAGTHAIAVGFPQKVHFAYDSEQIRLAEIWKGRFLDAQGTWYERFAPPADPLGKSHQAFPAGPTLRIVDSQKPDETLKGTFRGYRLQQTGVPVFLQGIGMWSVEEQLTVESDGRLRRTWELTTSEPLGFKETLVLDLVSGNTFERPEPGSIKEASGVTIRLMGGKKAEPTSTGWRIPLTKQSLTIEVQYQW